jgi:hypothetical protein
MSSFSMTEASGHSCKSSLPRTETLKEPEDDIEHTSTNSWVAVEPPQSIPSVPESKYHQQLANHLVGYAHCSVYKVTCTRVIDRTTMLF